MEEVEGVERTRVDEPDITQEGCVTEAELAAPVNMQRGCEVAPAPVNVHRGCEVAPAPVNVHRGCEVAPDNVRRGCDSAATGDADRELEAAPDVQGLGDNRLTAGGERKK